MTELVVPLKSSGDSKQKPSPLSLAPVWEHLAVGLYHGQYVVDKCMCTEYVRLKLNIVILESTFSLFQYFFCFPAKLKAVCWPLCHIQYSIPL